MSTIVILDVPTVTNQKEQECQRNTKKYKVCAVQACSNAKNTIKQQQPDDVGFQRGYLLGDSHQLETPLHSCTVYCASSHTTPQAQLILSHVVCEGRDAKR